MAALPRNASLSRPSMLEFALVLVGFLALLPPMHGCRQPKDSAPKDTRLVGRWEIDLPQTEANLRARQAASVQEQVPPDGEAEVAAQLDRFAGRAMVVTASTLAIEDAQAPLRGNYVVGTRNENNLILRIATATGAGSVDLTQLSDQQLAEQLEIEEGPLPFRIGFLFLDDNHVQVFHQSVRDGRVVDEPYMSPEVFRRVSATPEGLD